MRSILLLLVTVAITSCAVPSSSSSPQTSSGSTAQDNELEKLKKDCRDTNMKIFKMDLATCLQEMKDKKGMSKGQLDKEYRECSESASAKLNKESMKCY